jgi:hypothetical protein
LSLTVKTDFCVSSPYPRTPFVEITRSPFSRFWIETLAIGVDVVRGRKLAGRKERASVAGNKVPPNGGKTEAHTPYVALRVFQRH